jgi:plastocyanin
VLLPHQLPAQDHADSGGADLHARLDFSTEHPKDHAPAAVLWVTPAVGTQAEDRPPAGHFTLVQKNRMFTPHLLVVPVGSIISFPNADPFFHNVFSLFNGKRFDLGLYEAGKSKEVSFSREGVSYIFCNIHPEMSAVVLALSTTHYAIADRQGVFLLERIPPGDYEVHVWVEGFTQPSLQRLVRRVHLDAGKPETVVLDLREFSREAPSHLNKFGQAYGPAPKINY